MDDNINKKNGFQNHDKNENSNGENRPEFQVGQKIQDFDNQISNNFIKLELADGQQEKQIEQTEKSDYLEIEFKSSRRAIFKNDINHHYKQGDLVVVEVDNGTDAGIISACGNMAESRLKNWYDNEEPKHSIIRLGSESDINKYNNNRSEEEIVVNTCRELVSKHNLDMKVTEAEWQFDRQRLTIYFTAPQRVDFRELVKDLARNFKTRIELRQISSREETRRIGEGIGCCGLKLCCTSFLNDFCHVTLDHARTQQLSNNIAKLSGYCGRLKCCLLYEYENYVKAFENFPPIGSKVKLPDGIAEIIKIDIYKESVLLHQRKLNKYTNLNGQEIKQYQDDGKIEYPPEETHNDNSHKVENNDY